MCTWTARSPCVMTSTPAERVAVIGTGLIGTSIAMASVMFGLILHFQFAYGWSPVKAGLANLPIIVTAPHTKKLTDLQQHCPSASTYLQMPFTTEQLRKTVSEFVPSIAG